MKTTPATILTAGITVATVLLLCSASAADPPAQAEGTNAPPAPAQTAREVEPAPAANGLAQPTEPAGTNQLQGVTGNVAETTNVVDQVPAVQEVEVPAMSDGNSLRLNFRGASLEQVLNYLSEAAGFIIVLEAQPRGKIDVWSNQPLTRDEAVDLLNSALQRNGYAAIRRGRTLTIVNRDEIKTRAIPVKGPSSDPASIPETDEIVTQIIPVRFVEVSQLIKDLQPLVSVQTAMTANESGNSIVITDTQANIHRIAEIIQAIDMGAEAVTEVRVFRLQSADPVEMSDLLGQLFPDESRTGGGGQSPIQFGGFRRMFGGGPPGMAAAGGGSGTDSQRIKKRSRVISVPDQRTSSIVVSAARDLIEQIELVVKELDANPARKQTVKVIPLENADPQQAMQVLQDIFQKNGSQNSRNANQNSALQNRNQQNMQGMGTGNNRTGTRTGSTGTRRSSNFSR